VARHQTHQRLTDTPSSADTSLLNSVSLPKSPQSYESSFTPLTTSVGSLSLSPIGSISPSVSTIHPVYSGSESGRSTSWSNEREDGLYNETDRCQDELKQVVNNHGRGYQGYLCYAPVTQQQSIVPVSSRLDRNAVYDLPICPTVASNGPDRVLYPNDYSRSVGYGRGEVNDQSLSQEILRNEDHPRGYSGRNHNQWLA